MQLALLYICIRYRPRNSQEAILTSARPLSFWQWQTYSQYIEFLAGLMWASKYTTSTYPITLFRLCQAILFLIFGRSDVFVGLLGFAALGLESTLPIPQLIRYGLPGSKQWWVVRWTWYSNYRQRSLYGFRTSTLVGWVGGDAFKSAFFLFKVVSHWRFGALLEQFISLFNNHPFNSKSAPFFSCLLILVRNDTIYFYIATKAKLQPSSPNGCFMGMRRRCLFCFMRMSWRHLLL